jgi:hypothetical protein
MDQFRGLAQDLDDKQDITRDVATDVHEGGGTRVGGPGARSQIRARSMLPPPPYPAPPCMIRDACRATPPCSPILPSCPPALLPSRLPAFPPSCLPRHRHPSEDLPPASSSWRKCQFTVLFHASLSQPVLLRWLAKHFVREVPYLSRGVPRLGPYARAKRRIKSNPLHHTTTISPIRHQPE